MPFTTLPSAGSKLRASTLTSLITEVRPIVARKLATESRASTIVEAADTDMRIALPATDNWEFEILLLVDSIANAAGDFSFHLEFPAGATVDVAVHGLDLALPSANFADLKAIGTTAGTASPTGSYQFGCSTAVTAIIMEGRIDMGATAGDLQLFWAQQASNVNGTRLRPGSRITARMLD